ncbi:MAG TPA: hypothetical protein ENI05_10000 [Porticoccus sp.]|nr:hypothetical protein [Porticoccus sp.]
MAIINLRIEFTDSYIDTIKAFMVSRANELTGGQKTITNAEALGFIRDHFQRLANKFSFDAVRHAESSNDKTKLPIEHQTALTDLETAQVNLNIERLKVHP